MDFEVAGVKYRSEKMDAFKQFHVSRKMAPVVTEIIPLIGKIDLAADVSAIAPLVKVIAALPEADCDFIISTCLSTVKREVAAGVGYAPIWNAEAKRMMFPDIDNLPNMLQITASVIQDNLGSFMGALPTGLTVSVK